MKGKGGVLSGWRYFHFVLCNRHLKLNHFFIFREERYIISLGAEPEVAEIVFEKADCCLRRNAIDKSGIVEFIIDYSIVVIANLSV